MSALEQALTQIVKFLNANQVPYMVIGGIANLFWGTSRTTLDIDITVHVEEKKGSALIDQLKKCYQIRVEHPVSFIAETHVLPIQDQSGIRIDLIFATLPYEKEAIQRSKKVLVQGETIQVCSPEDLIIHKIVSDRTRDRDDVRGIVNACGSVLDRKYLDPVIKELAENLTKPELLQFYLSCFK